MKKRIAFVLGLIGIHVWAWMLSMPGWDVHHHGTLIFVVALDGCALLVGSAIAWITEGES